MFTEMVISAGPGTRTDVHDVASIEDRALAGLAGLGDEPLQMWQGDFREGKCRQVGVSQLENLRSQLVAAVLAAQRS